MLSKDPGKNTRGEFATSLESYHEFVEEWCSLLAPSEDGIGGYVPPPPSHWLLHLAEFANLSRQSILCKLAIKLGTRGTRDGSGMIPSWASRMSDANPPDPRWRWIRPEHTPSPGACV